MANVRLYTVQNNKDHIKKLPESFVYSDIDMYADSRKSL